MNWREIKDNQTEKRFYFDNRPLFKQFKNIIAHLTRLFATIQFICTFLYLKCSHQVQQGGNFTRILLSSINSSDITNTLSMQVNLQSSSITLSLVC